MQSNFKRFLAALLLAAMMLSLFAGCQTTTPELNHTHGSTVQVPGSTGTNPTTGTTKPTESTPGTDETDPTQPSTQPTTQPTDPTQPTGCAHSWSDWTVQKEAGCETDGTKIRICQLCSNAQQQTISKTGHSFSAWKTTQPTCTQNGSKSRTCSNCSKTESESIPATGHNWDEGKVTTTPTTCDDVGVKTFTCKTCGQKKVTQITGSHTFGEWEYEEYTYTYVSSATGKTKTAVSHRKVRYCTKCNYKESDGTPNHSCKIGSDNHTVTVEREGTCQQTKVYRSTCTVCGWSTTYDNGEYGNCVVTITKKHLTDYGAYTNELDVTIYQCSVCGGADYGYTVGKGLERYRMQYNVNCNSGTAYVGQGVSGCTDDRLVKHPTWQMVTRNEKFDSQGYLIQWDYIWHDKNGNRYSQTIKMEDIPAMFEAAGYNLDDYAGKSFTLHLTVDGNRIRPYKISWTG